MCDDDASSASDSDGGDGAALPAVPQHGLSLAGLLAFAAAHRTRTYDVQRHGDAAPQPLPFAALTTAEVVEAVIKPETERHGGTCTYAELLLASVRGSRVGALRPRALR